MTNKKLIKRALASSIAALFLCVAMLVGTTFAWFTDSAISEGNKITAGTLDVELYQWTDADTSVAISQSKDPVFDSDILWEPGYTSVVYLSIKNNGSLTLKYKVAIEVTEVSTHNLADVMEYAVTPDAKYGEVTSWAGNGTKITNAPGVNETAYQDITLAPGAEHFFALSIHMLEEATNEYQGETITFDIRVLAGQAVDEYDSFDNTYDTFAGYPGKGVAPALTQGESAREIRITGDDGYKVGSVVIPANAASGESFAVSVEKSGYTPNISVSTGIETITYDIAVEGLAENNTTPVKVSLKIPAGLDPATVKVYHYDELIDDSSYNPNTGYVTFETTSFSPFTLAFDPESEYVAPDVEEGMDIPTAIVTPYEITEPIEWGNYGQWSPTEGLEANLEAAFTFACRENLDPAVEAAFEYWYCDFYVVLNKDLGANQLFLGGNYGTFGWIGFHNGDQEVAANTEIPLLGSVTSNPWTYADVRDYVGTFTCGVGDVEDALEGATFTVMLRLTNPNNEAEFYNVNVVTYTFGGSYTIE